MDAEATKDTLIAVLQRGPVAYYAAFADAFGGVKAGVFLSQLFYWSGKGKDSDGWIFKKRQDFQNETGLTRSEQETARKALKDAGVLEETLRGTPPIVHYRINWDNLLTVLASNLRETSKSIGGDVANQDAGNQQILTYTKITPETTSETTSPPLLEPSDVWSEWYDELQKVPTFKGSFEKAETWRVKHEVTEAHALKTALALLSKWPGPVKSPYRNAWATFRGWALSPPLPSRNNGAGGNGAGQLHHGYGSDKLYQDSIRGPEDRR